MKVIPSREVDTPVAGRPQSVELSQRDDAVLPFLDPTSYADRRSRHRADACRAWAQVAIAVSLMMTLAAALALSLGEHPIGRLLAAPGVFGAAIALALACSRRRRTGRLIAYSVAVNLVALAILAATIFVPEEWPENRSFNSNRPLPSIPAARPAPRPPARSR